MFSQQISKINPLKKYVANANSPVCINCIHFQKNEQNIKQSTCAKYAKRNIVTGEITNDLAMDCRKFVNKCGPGFDYVPIHKSTIQTFILYPYDL